MAAEQRRHMAEPRRAELAHQSTTYEVAIRPGTAALDSACRGGGEAAILTPKTRAGTEPRIITYGGPPWLSTTLW